MRPRLVFANRILGCLEEEDRNKVLECIVANDMGIVRAFINLYTVLVASLNGCDSSVISYPYHDMIVIGLSDCKDTDNAMHMLAHFLEQLPDTLAVKAEYTRHGFLVQTIPYRGVID